MAKSVLILMGSKSDLTTMSKAAAMLRKLGVEYELTVASAHRSPERVDRLVQGARDRGVGVVIAGAGLAAHLAGVCASATSLPVIGVPLAGGKLAGLDALLSTVQMPSGMPVATVGIDMATNAAVLAAQMLAIEDADLAARLEDERAEMAKAIEEAAAELES